MDDVRSANLHTRRTALTFIAAAAVPACIAQNTNQTGGKPKMAHPVVHFDIGCRDREKTGRFFSELFGWKIDSGPTGAIDTGTQRGIAGHITSLGHEPHNYTMFYVEVEDIQAYLDKVNALGGKTVVPPIKIPTGKFAWFTDPEGNMVGLLQPA